jgi:hypothetical protein
MATPVANAGGSASGPYITDAYHTCGRRSLRIYLEAYMGLFAT